jgi:hypothetical protein
MAGFNGVEGVQLGKKLWIPSSDLGDARSQGILDESGFIVYTELGHDVVLVHVNGVG